MQEGYDFTHHHAAGSPRRSRRVEDVRVLVLGSLLLRSYLGPLVRVRTKGEWDIGSYIATEPGRSLETLLALEAGNMMLCLADQYTDSAVRSCFDEVVIGMLSFTSSSGLSFSSSPFRSSCSAIYFISCMARGVQRRSLRAPWSSQTMPVGTAMVNYS